MEPTKASAAPRPSIVLQMDGLSELSRVEDRESSLYILTFVSHWLQASSERAGDLGQGSFLKVQAITKEGWQLRGDSSQYF